MSVAASSPAQLVGDGRPGGPRGDHSRFFRLAPDPLVVLDVDGMVVGSNPALRALAAPLDGEHGPVDPRRWIHPADVPGAVAAFRTTCDDAVATTLHCRMSTRTAERVWVQWRLIADAGSGLVYGIGRDVTDHVQTERQLRVAATTDSLTGLANRHALLDRINRFLGEGVGFAVLYVDVDNFKPINDSHGHAYGDAVLRAIARRLTRAVRSTDLCGRIGGDEFVIVTRQPAHARQLAVRLLQTTHEPIVVDGRRNDLTLSIGVAEAAAHGDSADRLVSAADLALYTAKRAGGGVCRVAADAAAIGSEPWHSDWA